jgi:AcrR family transcriptional regulator
MRYSQDHKAQTHKRIIKEASVRVRRDGIGATGLQPLMKALGLTHGGFYSHFKSKDELVEKALQAAGDEVDVTCAELFAQDRPLEAFINAYLSQWHQTSPHEGLPAADHVFGTRHARPAEPHFRRDTPCTIAPD